MKKVLLAVGLVLCIAGPALAGGLGPMVSMWSTDQADDDNGFGAKLELDVGPHWDLELRGAQFDGFELRAQGAQFDLEAFPLDLGLAYNFAKEDKINPYVGFGVSYVLLDVDATFEGRKVDARMKDDFGFYALAGFEAKFYRNLAIFAEAFFRQTKGRIQGDNIDSPFVDVPVDFAGPGGHVGLLMTF